MDSRDRRPLAACLVADVVSAALTSIVVTPAVLLVDSSIILRAASSKAFHVCLREILGQWARTPAMVVQSAPPRLVFLVYLGTFTSANFVKTTQQRHDSSRNSIGKLGFLATASISTGLTVYKDSRLARIFGNAASTRGVPLASYCLFALRDAITIFASFNGPPILAPRLSGVIERESRRLNAAQFILPMSVQLVTTPIHLLGLDLYNRKGSVGLVSRVSRVGRDLATAVPARMFRVLPAFGIGGVLNSSLRTSLQDTAAGKGL